MSSSLALQIDNAIAALLSASGAPAPVDRAATIDYTHENMPAYNIAEHKAEPNFAESTSDSLSVVGEWVVLCYAVARSEATARAAADPLLVFAWKQLEDSTLGGLCTQVRVKGYQCNYDKKSGLEVIEVQLNLEILYDTMRGDPSQNYN